MQLHSRAISQIQHLKTHHRYSVQSQKGGQQTNHICHESIIGKRQYTYRIPMLCCGCVITLSVCDASLDVEFKEITQLCCATTQALWLAVKITILKFFNSQKNQVKKISWPRQISALLVTQEYMYFLDLALFLQRSCFLNWDITSF